MGPSQGLHYIHCLKCPWHGFRDMDGDTCPQCGARTPTLEET